MGGVAGQPEAAVECFGVMLRAGTPPSPSSCNAVLTLCADRGDWELALDAHRRMTYAGIPSDTSTFNQLVRAPPWTHRRGATLSGLGNELRELISRLKASLCAALRRQIGSTPTVAHADGGRGVDHPSICSPHLSQTGERV